MFEVETKVGKYTLHFKRLRCYLRRAGFKVVPGVEEPCHIFIHPVNLSPGEIEQNKMKMGVVTECAIKDAGEVVVGFGSVICDTRDRCVHELGRRKAMTKALQDLFPKTLEGWKGYRKAFWDYYRSRFARDAEQRAMVALAAETARQEANATV